MPPGGGRPDTLGLVPARPAYTKKGFLHQTFLPSHWHWGRQCQNSSMVWGLGGHLDLWDRGGRTWNTMGKSDLASQGTCERGPCLPATYVCMSVLNRKNLWQIPSTFRQTCSISTPLCLTHSSVAPGTLSRDETRHGVRRPTGAVKMKDGPTPSSEGAAESVRSGSSSDGPGRCDF